MFWLTVAEVIFIIAMRGVSSHGYRTNSVPSDVVGEAPHPIVYQNAEKEKPMFLRFIFISLMLFPLAGTLAADTTPEHDAIIAKVMEISGMNHQIEQQA